MEYHIDAREIAWALFLRFCLIFSFILGLLAICLHLPGFQYSALSNPLFLSSWSAPCLFLLLVLSVIVVTQRYRYLASQSLRIEQGVLHWRCQREALTIQRKDITNILFVYRHHMLQRICIRQDGRRLIQLRHFCDIDALAKQLQHLFQDRPDVLVCQEGS